MLISVDHGNSAIKTNNISFISGLTEYPVRPPLADDIIKYQGVYWTLTGNRIAYMRNKTRDERFFILTLFAISKEMEKAGGVWPGLDIDLAAGLPPEHYSILKDDFSEYFRRVNVNFTYNDIPHCVNFDNVFVYPQAYAAVVPYSKMFITMPRVFIVDIGGFTIDVLLLRYGKPDLQFCRSLELGVIPMNNEIISKISSQYDLRIEDDHIAEVLQGHNTILPDRAVIAIHEMVIAYVNNIINKLRELQVDLRVDPAVFLGGGGNLFRLYMCA